MSAMFVNNYYNNNVGWCRSNVGLQQKRGLKPKFSPFILLGITTDGFGDGLTTPPQSARVKIKQ